jgi:hypothetical protein
MSHGFEATVSRSIHQMKKMLQNVARWLEQATRHAEANSFDPSILLGAWLAPDQIPLVRQVQNACDRAGTAAARLAGVEQPHPGETAQTIAELCARVQMWVDYLDDFSVEDFHDAEARLIELPFLENKIIAGDDYLRELVLPAFYFHVTTAYALLRHNGVRLNMRDFIGETSVRDR